YPKNNTRKRTRAFACVILWVNILLLHLVHLKPSDLTSPVFATIEMTAVVLYGAILQHPNAIVVLII
uniref:hypothetical protein n=1 Tax=Gemmiger formicilis TaxID=745368 RepID=UPI0040299582